MAASASGPSGDVPHITAWTDLQRSAARRLLPGCNGNVDLDRLAGLAARVLSVPSAMASLLTDVQTVAGGAGLPSSLAVGSIGPLSDSVCLLTARDAEPVLISDARLDPRLSRVPYVESGDIVAYLGVPLTADNGQIVGALCVFDTRPRSWTDMDATLLTELAASAVADLELEALGREFDLSRTRSGIAIEAADMGTFEFDIRTGRLVWDERLMELFGFGAGDEFDGTAACFEHRVHPADTDLVVAAMENAIASAGLMNIRYRIVQPGGQVRWLQARGRVIADDAGVASRMVGVAFDVTPQQDALAHSQRLLDAMKIGVLALDVDFRFTWVNFEAARIAHLSREDMIGRSMWELFPGAVGSVFEDVYRRVARTRQAESFEAFYPQPLNIWVEVRVQPDDGDGILLNTIDVTAQHELRELLQMSVDIGIELAQAVDADTALGALARRTVPALGDWAVVSLLEPDGCVRDVLSWHADHSMVPDVQRYAAHRMEGGGSGIVQGVIASGEPQLIPEGVLAVGLARLQSGDARDAIDVLEPESVGVFPLLSGDRVIGVLCLFRGAQRPAMTLQERDVAMSICRRGGMAVDNRRLVAALAETAEHNRTVAGALQEALLTTLPSAAGMSIEARYLPAADHEQVGGDWYDAMVKPGGTLAIAIGDVMGHDIVAAGVMGQLRGMLRTFAWDRDEPAADMLCRLDRAISGMQLGAIASVVSARIEPGPHAGSRTLRWSNAGHPPPLLLNPDGSVEILHAERPDMLLGVRPDWPRHDHARPFPVGSAVLLYTDGLIESRVASLDDGLARLAESVAAHRDLKPGELLDAVLADLVGARPNDDVALLFVRAD